MRFLELRVPPPFVALVVGALMWMIARLTPALALPDKVRVLVALTVAAAGFAIAAAGVFAFRRAGTTLSPVEPREATSLVTTGIYARTRNPMYLGWFLLLAGWGVFLASPAAMLGPAAFWLYIDRFQIVPEERALAKLFGSSYAAFVARVRRWI